MSKDKKLSFSDFVVDDDFNSTNDNLDDGDDKPEPDKDDDDQDDVVEPPKPDKKVKPKARPNPQSVDEPDEDVDEPEPDKSKDKKIPKVEPKQPIVKDEDKSDEEVEDASKFFEEVEKLSGTTVDVEYGEINPLSPQGVVLRDKAIKEQALDSFLEEIESKFPQAFKALQHAYAGGDIAQLFTQTTGRDYTKIELKDGDDALAKDILKEYYKSRGVKSESKISKMIEADEDSENGIVKEAQVALQELKEEQEQSTAKILEQQKQKASEEKKKDQILVAAVDEVLEARKLGNFRIQDRQEAAEFKKFVLTSIRKGKDGYELATPLATNTLERQLQFAYFAFKQGDLSKIVQQKVTTENARKLSLKLSQEQSKSKRSTQEEQKNTLTLRDFTS